MGEGGPPGQAASMMKLMHERNLEATVLAKCSSETRQVFLNPHSASAERARLGNPPKHLQLIIRR
jgi:hypothetical protein